MSTQHYTYSLLEDCISLIYENVPYSERLESALQRDTAVKELQDFCRAFSFGKPKTEECIFTVRQLRENFLARYPINDASNIDDTRKTQSRIDHMIKLLITALMTNPNFLMTGENQQQIREPITYIARHVSYTPREVCFNVQRDRPRIMSLESVANVFYPHLPEIRPWWEGDYSSLIVRNKVWERIFFNEAQMLSVLKYVGKKSTKRSTDVQATPVMDELVAKKTYSNVADLCDETNLVLESRGRPRATRRVLKPLAAKRITPSGRGRYGKKNITAQSPVK